MKVSTTGYKRNSKDKKHKQLFIPGDQSGNTNLTMLGVDHYVQATPVYPNGNFGGSIMMRPGVPTYNFPGAMGVIEQKLPKAQDGTQIVGGIEYLGDVTQNENNYWDERYNYWRSKNLSYKDAYDAATADVNTLRGPSHPYYVYNSNAFLPNKNSGVNITAKKPNPYKHLQDWPDFNESGAANDFYGNIDDAARWEKQWYSKRAKLPQFKDIAEERLSLANSIDMQPWSEDNWKNSGSPNASGYYSPDDATVNIPQFYFSRPSLYTHERSHWYDYNAPQDKTIKYQPSGYYRKNPLPLYNYRDPILNNIIPIEYTVPGGEGATNDFYSKDSIYAPFKSDSDTDYYYMPTEVRARLNEWRRIHNIDPIKDYSTDEIQQIIDKDINSGNFQNFDLYKVIRGRGDLLKQIHDAYVSTGDKESSDDLPKAQKGLPIYVESKNDPRYIQYQKDLSHYNKQKAKYDDSGERAAYQTYDDYVKSFYDDPAYSNAHYDYDPHLGYKFYWLNSTEPDYAFRKPTPVIYQEPLKLEPKGIFALPTPKPLPIIQKTLLEPPVLPPSPYGVTDLGGNIGMIRKDNGVVGYVPLDKFFGTSKQLDKFYSDPNKKTNQGYSISRSDFDEWSSNVPIRGNVGDVQWDIYEDNEKEYRNRVHKSKMAKGGSLPKAQDGPPNQGLSSMGAENRLYTYKDDAAWFDNRSTYSDNSRYSDQIRHAVYSGNYGYNPVTGVLEILPPSKRTKVSTETKRRLAEAENKEARRLAAAENKEAYRQSIIDAGFNPETFAKPTAEEEKAEEERRIKDFVRKGYELAMYNPVFKTAAYFTPTGMAVGAVEGAAHFLPDVYNFIENPSWGGVANVGIDALLAAPIARQLFSNAGALKLPKYNPWAWEPNANSFYHRNSNLENVVNPQTGMLQSWAESAAGKAYTEANLNKTGLKFKKGAKGNMSFSKGIPLDGVYSNNKYPGPYLIEVSGETVPFRESVKGSPVSDVPGEIIGSYNVPGRPIALSEAKFYKEHPIWGYKPIEMPIQTPPGFKSEVDWGKWNPDTPNHPELINEYNAIEKSTKKAGTWMKNPDGSSFKGTPEQFIQQQSSHFKKAFGESKLLNPDGSPMILYHGSAKKFDTFDPSKFQLGDAGYSGAGIYTVPSKVTANSYALSSAKFHSGDIEPTVYQLYGKGNRPIRSSDLIKEDQGRDLFNFYRDRNWKGELSPYESLRDYDVAISDQLPNVENIRPIHDAREIVFPTNTQVKSAVGNVGFFDMTNPNIYKMILPPALLLGAGAASQQKLGGTKFQDGGSLSKAQTIGEFKPSYDWRLSPQENMELNRRAQAAGHNSVAEYEASGWAWQPKQYQTPSVQDQVFTGRYSIPKEDAPLPTMTKSKISGLAKSTHPDVQMLQQKAADVAEWVDTKYKEESPEEREQRNIESLVKQMTTPDKEDLEKVNEETGYAKPIHTGASLSAMSLWSPEDIQATGITQEDVDDYLKQQYQRQQQGEKVGQLTLDLAFSKDLDEKSKKSLKDQLEKEKNNLNEANKNVYGSSFNTKLNNYYRTEQDLFNDHNKYGVAQSTFGPLDAIVSLPALSATLAMPILGTSLTLGSAANPFFYAAGINGFLNPNSDFSKAAKSWSKGTGSGEDVLLEAGLNSLNFLGARSLPSDIKNFGKAYQEIATGESIIPYAWRSPAVGLSQEASAEMFNSLLNSGKLTPAERNLVLEYQYNSNPFTGRFVFVDSAKRDALNNIISKYELQFPQNSNAIATRRFNMDKDPVGMLNKEDGKIYFSGKGTLGANIEGSRINFGDRPTSFSAGVGVPGYGGAPDRLVIPSRYLPKMKNNFIINGYSPLSQEQLQLFENPSLKDFASKMGTNPNLIAERELIGTGLDFRQIGKVKNDIGGYDYIVKPRSVASGTTTTTEGANIASTSNEILGAAQSSNIPENLAKQGYKSTHKQLADLTDELRRDRVKFWQSPTGKARLEAVIENTPELKAAGITVGDYIRGIESMTVENRTAVNNLMRGKMLLDEQKAAVKQLEEMKFLEQQTGMVHPDQSVMSKLEQRIQSLDDELRAEMNDFYKLRVNSKYKDNAFMARTEPPVKSEPGVHNLQKVGVNKDTRFTTGVGPTYNLDEAERIINHEFGHLIQRGVKTNLDKELEGLDLLKNEASDLFSSANKDSNYFDKALNYFRSGSQGKEKLPFLEEVRSDMLQKGIIKDFGDDITEDMIRNHYANYMMEGRSDKGALRIYDIMKDNPKNFSILHSVLNKMPAVVIGTGVGFSIDAATQQKKKGGKVAKYNSKALDDYFTNAWASSRKSS